MDKILLIVPQFELRQLYHEVLLSKHLEVVPVDNLAAAILLLTIETFKKVIYYVEESSLETEMFIKLREKYKNLSTVGLILLTDDITFKKRNSENYIVLSPLRLSIEEISERIKCCI